MSNVQRYAVFYAEIDTGKIIFQEKELIEPFDNAGILHDKLMETGAQLVVKTVNSIQNKSYPQVSQGELLKPGTTLRNAPKIFKDDCKISWSCDVLQVFNFIRGLSSYPCAWSDLSDAQGNLFNVKIYEAEFEQTNSLNYKPGEISTDSRTYLKVAALNGFIKVKSLQLQGKKRLNIDEFLRGFHNIEQCRFL